MVPKQKSQQTVHHELAKTEEIRLVEIQIKLCFRSQFNKTQN